MLDAFRSKGLQSAIYGILIVATVIVFVVQFNPSAGKKSAKLTQSCAATVRGTCIDPKDHRAAFMLLVPFDEHGARLIGKAKSMHIPQIALDGLIERELLIEEAHRIGLTATEDEVSDAIISGFLRVSIPADKPELQVSLQAYDGKRYFGFWFRDPKTKEFDEKVYKRSLKNLVNESEVEFREFEENEILAAKMRDLVRAPVRVSEDEALQSYMAEKSFAVVTYIEVKPAFVARYGASAAPTDAEVEAWAKQPENAKIIESTLASRKKDAPKDGNLRHILVRVSPTDGDKEHQDALAKTTEAYARIERGEPFADVARAMSDDSSKSKGGSLDTEKTESFVPAFKAAADALKNGEMTHTAIETQYGYHLIERDSSGNLPKDVARELYLKSRLDDQARDLAARILAQMTKAGKSADDAVKAETASLKPIPFIKVTLDKSLDRGHASADAGAMEGGAGDAGHTGDGGAPAAPRTSLEPDHDDDRPVALTSTSLRRGGDSLQHLDVPEAKKLLDFAFSSKDGTAMPEPLKIEGGGYYDIVLKEHKLATKEDFDKDRVTYTETLLRARQNEALALYVRRLLDAAKPEIKRDEAYMSEWTGDAGAFTEDEEP